MTNDELMNKDQWSVAFLDACQYEDVDKIRGLCQKKYIEKEFFNLKTWHEGFHWACIDGSLGVVRYLTTDQALKDQGYPWADIQKRGKEGVGCFELACTYGHLDVVKFLLTSPDLKAAGHTFADLHAMENDGFRMACRYGYLDIVQYLLTSPELKEAGHAFADVHAMDDYGFRWACASEKYETLRWLIVDYGIDKTPAIDEMIKDYPQVQDMFRVREELRVLHDAMIKNYNLKNHSNEHECPLNEEKRMKIKKL